MTTPEGMTTTQQRQRRRLLIALSLPSLICFTLAGVSFWLGGSDEDLSWPALLGGAITGLVVVVLLFRYVIQPRLGDKLAAAQRARQDNATLDAMEPLGPTTHDGGQR